MGQFMTPAPVASFMASLFTPTATPIRLLDPGAGLGALSCAVIDRWQSGQLGDQMLSLTAYEKDTLLCPHLQAAYDGYDLPKLSVSIRSEDFLTAVAERRDAGSYTHAILNPPYKKIAVTSQARKDARAFGLETVNLYSAFVGAALQQLGPGGQLVAIIPRSFCNGPYYKPFRQFILKRAALDFIHVFDSRSDAFKDDDVLQENVIVRLTQPPRQASVTVSSSTDQSFADLDSRAFPFDEVVRPKDPELFIRIPTEDSDPLADPEIVNCTLRDLDLAVSTGPVVDFRLKSHLRDSMGTDTVPLLYPGHFTGTAMSWPNSPGRKPNALVQNDETVKWLFQAGRYVVVRRFSSKEEKRRVVAAMIDPERLGGATAIGIENHLNVFHRSRGSLPSDLAWGLFVFLNSSLVDEHFRRFNGHTQVNATDLKNMRYPTAEQLVQLGEGLHAGAALSQDMIDERVCSVLRIQ